MIFFSGSIGFWLLQRRERYSALRGREKLRTELFTLLYALFASGGGRAGWLRRELALIGLTIFFFTIAAFFFTGSFYRMVFRLLGVE